MKTYKNPSLNATWSLSFYLRNFFRHLYRRKVPQVPGRSHPCSLGSNQGHHLRVAPDCSIAKVDGPAQVDLPRTFGKFWPPHLYTFLHIFVYFLYFLGSLAPPAPPAYRLSILYSKKLKNIHKIEKNYKNQGVQIFQKSWVNQPNQGNQPWQSNSLHKVSKGGMDANAGIIVMGDLCNENLEQGFQEIRSFKNEHLQNAGGPEVPPRDGSRLVGEVIQRVQRILVAIHQTCGLEAQNLIFQNEAEGQEH